MSCYNNGSWDSTPCDTSTNFCEAYIDKPSYLITQIVPIIFDFDSTPSSASGPSVKCLNITLLPSNIMIKYVKKSDIIPSNTQSNSFLNVTGDLITLDPLSYSSYECSTISSISVSIDLSNITGGPTDAAGSATSYYKPSNFTVDLPIDNTISVTKLELTKISTSSDDCIEPTTQAELLINYYYIGYCSNITVTITKIRIKYISTVYPLYQNPNEIFMD